MQLRASMLKPSRPGLMRSPCSADRASPPTSANNARMAVPQLRTKFLFSLVLLFALFHSSYCASALEANSTQHPFTLSTFVVPASTSPASEASLSHQPVFLSEAVTEKVLEDDMLTPANEAVVTDRPTKKPMPVLYRHGKILETSRLVSQDSMGGFPKAQPLRPHRLGLYPTELGPVFEAPPSSSEEPSPVLPSSSLMETFMAFEPESSAPPVAASTSSTVDPKDVRPTRTVSTPLVITEAKMAKVQSADGTSKADKTVTLFGFVDFTTSLSGTKIIFKPTATRRPESPQEQVPVANPSPPSSSSSSTSSSAANFDYLFKKSKVQEIKASKPSSSRKFPFRSASRSSSSVQPSQTQSRAEKYKTGLVKSKTGTTVKGGVTTEFTTLIYGTFIQGSYAHIIRSTSSIYATPTMQNPGVSMTTMVGSETSVASVGRPLAYPETNEDSELMNSDSVVVLGKSSSVVPSAVIITEGFILPSDAQVNSIKPTSTVQAVGSTMVTGDVMLPAMQDVLNNELDSSMKPLASSPPSQPSSTGVEVPTMLLADPSGSSMTSIQYVAPKRVESSTVEPTSVTLYTTYTHFTTMYNSGSASVFSNHEVVSNVHTTMVPKAASEPAVTVQSQETSSENMRHMILIVSPTQTTATESVTETPSMVEASTPSAQSPMDLLDETPSLSSSSYDFTTYTYYTTFIKKGKTSITSRTSVVSNLVAAPSSTSIVPTPSATLTEPATSTYFTTYTYYTTFFRRGSSRIRSREKVETNIVTIFPGSTITATTEVLTPITVYKDHSPVVSFAKVPKVYLTTVDERTETNRADLTTAVKATTTFTFLTTTTDSLGNEVVSTSFSTLEGLATRAPDISPTKRVRTDFTTFTYFSTTTHPGGINEVNSRSEVITSYVTEEPSRKKRDVQQKLETTFTDLVTTFDHGRPVVSTRRHTVTLGTLHITDTVPLPAATRLEPAVTRIVEPALVREHVPIDPRPVDHTYYTTYSYFTTTLSHGIPVTQTRYEVVTQVRHIDATPGIPGAIADRSSGSCRRCADAEYPKVVDAYPKIAPSTIYPGGRHHTAYSTLTFYTTHYPKGTSYVETRYSVVTNVATATVTNQLPGLRGPDPSCPHHHTTFTYFTTRFAGPTATVDVQKETVAKCDGAVPVIGATRVVPESVVIEERHRPALVVHEDHRDHVHKPCTVCLPDYSRKTFYTTYTHYTTVLDNHGHPSVSTRYETYTDILSGVRPTRTRHAREATRETAIEDIAPSKTKGAPPLTTILKNDQSEIYQREASSQLARITRSSERPVFAKRRLLQFQQPLGDPSSSYYLPQFTNYNDQPYASRVLQPSANNYYNPQQYDFQQYQPYQGYPQQNPYQHPYSEYPYEYHSQVPVPPQNDFHNQLAGFQQSFNPPLQQQPQQQPPPHQQPEPQLPPPQQPQQSDLNQFSPLLSYDVNPPNQLVEPVPPIEATPPTRSLIRSSKLKRKTILRKTKPTPTFEFNPQTPLDFNPQAPVDFNPQTPLDFNPDSYVTPTRIRKSSVVRRRPQSSAEYSAVNEELAGIPAASPIVESSYFVLETPSLIRSSRVVPRQRASSVFAPEPSAPSQFLFETAKVEEPVTEAPETEKRRIKVKKNPDGSRKAIVSSRVQKARDPLTSVAAPITFYTTFTYMTTFLHGTHTVYQSRESVVTSVHSVVDPTLLSQISNGYYDGTATPVSSRTRGYATTIVNLQSRLAVQSDETPVASPVVEAPVNTMTTLDLQQLENVRKTVYVLQTYMYTVVDEAGELHTSSKTEIKSSIHATPTALNVIPTEQMSISNGFLALDNTRTVNLANDVRNGKTTKVDLSLRTVVKLDNIGDAILATQAAVLNPSTIEPSSTVVDAYLTSQTVAPTSEDANRKRIKIKSIVRKRPSASIESSIVDPTELFESSSVHGTPALVSSTEALPEFTSATVSPSKQVKRLKVTIRKKASRLLKPVLDSVVSTTSAETLRSAPRASQFRGRLRASRIISRRVRPSDLIRQSPILSVTPVAFTTTTRLPIEVSGSTEYRDVELTTFSLVTSTITPSFFPASPQFTRPASIQASPVVLTYFTTTTYTIPVTRNGVATYSTSEHTNSRLVTQYPEPSSLQPSLVLDAALVNELQTPRISDFETKTMFTTYTYYTTYYSKGSTSVVSSLNIISNTVQVPVLSSIAPTAVTPLTILKTSERLRVSTSYSTFTFYATLFNGTSSLVTPFEEVQSQVFTLTESFVVTRTVSIAPTSTATLDLPSSAAPEPSQTSSSQSFTLFTLAPASTSSRASGPLVPSVKTFLTTFTYFTTFFRQSSSYVISKESVVTSYATLFVDAAKVRPTTTKKPVQTSTTALDPRFPYTTYTSYTTYTFYTTLFGGKDKIVISSEQIVPQVVTRKVDATLANIAPTTTSYSTFTAPPVTEELPASIASTTRSTLTFELAPSTESSGSSSTEPSTSLEPVADVTTTSNIPTVAMPEIIIRDQKPTVSLRKKASAATTLSSAATTLPHTQTIILASSTRFFGRDRSLTHIGAGSTLLLITGTDGLISRSHGTPTATAPAIGASSADSTKIISPSTTTPGNVLDLTDILGGKGGKLGEAIKGIVNLFNTKNGTDAQSPSSKISREDTSLPSGPIMVSSQEPLFIPLSPVLDISSFISPNSASGVISPTSRADSKLTPVYKPNRPKEEKEAHIPLEKLMSDLSKAKTKILVDSPTISPNSRRIIPSTTIKFEDSNPSESVSVIVGAETIFFDEGVSTEIPDIHGALQPTGVLRSVSPTSRVVVVTPEVEIAKDSLLPPGYEVQAQSSGGLWPTASFAPAETLVPEDGIKASKPTIYFQVSSTVVTDSPAKEVDYGGVKVFIAGRGNRKPVEPVIKAETGSQSTRKPLPNIFKVGNRKGGPSTTAKPISNAPKVKISFPKPPSPTEDKPEDSNDIFDAFKPFNNTNREQFDGPTPTPLCYPACDSSRHETCSPNPSKSARNKYICVCRPGYTRDTESTSSRCIASQTYLLPVHLVRASSKGSVQSQMPRLLHALKVSLEQTYSDALGFPKGSLLDAKVNTVQKVTNYNNESSIVLTLALSQRATNTDLSLPSLSSQLARSASKLNDSLEQLQSPFVLLGSSPIDALKDLDECSSSDLNDCSAYAKCINVPGSFHCECKSGYQDLDSESPGRTCSSEIKNCQFCSARGSCILGVDNGVEKTTCRCNTMYLGRRCEINGLVLTIALPIALSLLTLTICCSVRRCRPRYRTNAVKPPLPQNKMAMAYPGSGSLLTASDKGHSDKTQMISDSSSEGETSHGGDHWHHHHHHSTMDGRHTQMSSGGYSGYGDSLADTLANHHLPSIVIPRVRPKLPVRQR